MNGKVLVSCVIFMYYLIHSYSFDNVSIIIGARFSGTFFFSSLRELIYFSQFIISQTSMKRKIVCLVEQESWPDDLSYNAIDRLLGKIVA